MNFLSMEPKHSKYHVWFEHNGFHNIWYEKETLLDDYYNWNIPKELKLF